MTLFSPATFVIAFGLFLAVAWFLRRPMSGRVRRMAPGEFVQITGGLIHYQWHGPKDGPVLVKVHGLTTPSFVWRDQLADLTGAGYRVLTFDHFGRGYSDRPYASHTMAFYVREIDELLEKLDVPAGYNLLGYSMGGAIAAHYAALRRDRIKRLILLAPAGLSGAEPNWITRWPVIGDVAMFLFGGWTLRRGSRRAGRVEGVDNDMIEKQCRETRFAGFGAAVLSSLRHVIYIDQTEVHRRLQDRGLPVLAMFGTKDDVIPVSCAMRLREINRSAQVIEIEGAGHSLVTTHAKKVNRAVLAFLSDREQVPPPLKRRPSSEA
ncbi:alpha/beta fold hydrolase [Neptunicoccus cionae]|uniref:Alpha/beta hydrolase n=1 Tax=Neptunicoccus cionae TaxID=2035344 RepID=A0A916VQ41_9RHOB|nr:alpha/beta hydrolase [Amylibacter cionae]GGA18219.1 alpha/beta hydrolase [Amylibacter cionae]